MCGVWEAEEAWRWAAIVDGMEVVEVRWEVRELCEYGYVEGVIATVAGGLDCS